MLCFATTVRCQRKLVGLPQSRTFRLGLEVQLTYVGVLQKSSPLDIIECLHSLLALCVCFTATPSPDWYSSSLGPVELLATDSAPFGQIPHGLVVPLSELSLDELIGEGAEGKVRGPLEATQHSQGLLSENRLDVSVGQKCSMCSSLYCCTTCNSQDGSVCGCQHADGTRI